MNQVPPKRQVFLSHSGRDADRATRLAAILENKLASVGHGAEVFNTSVPEYRYKDLQEVLRAGEEWRARAQECDEELRAYLRKNLLESSAFLALVTPNSLAAGSRFIEFEIDVARTTAKERARGPFFFPCVADGARLEDLPEGAMEFQGIELDKGSGLELLFEALVRGLSEDR